MDDDVDGERISDSSVDQLYASHGKKVDKTLTVHVELGKTSLNFRSRS